MNRHLQSDRCSEVAGPDWARVRALIDEALAEDARFGAAGGEALWLDLTTDVAVSPLARAEGRLVAKSSGRLAGLEVFRRVLERCDPELEWSPVAQDGDPLEPGRELARVRARAAALLVGERTALNFVQRLSGIATLTARYVAACAGRARILDTRKTTPTLRALEKYAVRCGGGENHRFGLFDEVMVKNNHADLAGCPYSELLARIRAAVGPRVRITAEARDLEEALWAARGDVDVVMLDNFGPAEIERVVPQVRAAALGGRELELEASGGITLDNVGRFAATGVERISVGALTHSATALDLSLYLAPQDPKQAGPHP